MSTTFAEGIRDLLAESSTMRTLLGAADVAAAKLKMSLHYEDSQTIPYVMIRAGSRNVSAVECNGASAANGEIAAEIVISSEGDIETECADLDEDCHTIVADVLAKSCCAGYLIVREGDVESIQYPDSPEIQSSGEYLRANLTFHCGPTHG